MEDLLRKGRISRAESSLQLQELRQSLKLQDQDHHTVVRQLSEREPRLLEIDGLQRQRAQREPLEQIRFNSGVNPTEWDTLLKGLGPESPRQLQLLRSDRVT